MDTNVLYFRTTQRGCVCKCCDKDIEKNTEKVIVFRTFRGHGDTIHICLDCVAKINKLISDEK